MTRVKKFTAVSGALIVVIAITYFLAPQSYKEHLFIQPVETAVSDPAPSPQPDNNQLGSEATVNSSSPPSRDPADGSQPHSETTQPYSPVLSEIVTQENLKSDIEAWEEQMEEKGRAFVSESGHKVYIEQDSRLDRQDPDSLNKFSNNTSIEEIVALAQKGDPSAMLALANVAYSARRWAEGDYYAIEATRISGSSEPILHGALRRREHAGQDPFLDQFLDNNMASWFLAAYLQGNLTAAQPVEAYFRMAEIEDQVWVVNRAHEIIALINQGG
ncbi:MAG: hypothetical protein L3J22_07940 [Xanthomonadales bacterium]|nr:hypothetical protein [Xanthomonadales bacterium]